MQEYTVKSTPNVSVELKEISNVPVTDPTDNPTTGDETTTSDIKNPETSDNIVVYSLLTLISALGIGAISLKLKRKISSN